MALSKFGAAFRAARDKGEKTFEFPPGSGKMFTTRTKEDEQKDTDKRVMKAEEDRRANAPVTKAEIRDSYKPIMRDIIKEKAAKEREEQYGSGLKKGGVPKYKHGGSVRGDGIAKRGKTRGRMC